MKRFKPYIFCRKRKNKSNFPCENVHIDPQFKQLDRMLQNHNFQLIHARFGPSGIRMLRLKEFRDVPLVTSFHGCDSPGTARMKKHKESLQHLFAVGDCFTVPCQAMKHELVLHGCPEEKIVVHYSGINVDQFAYKERSLPADGPIRIIYVGRLVEKKGADMLIKAFYRVHQAFPQARLSLIGDGELKHQLKRLSKTLRLEKYVEFLGSLPHQEITKQLDQAHIFCLPSMTDRTGNMEGIPNAIKEAMASGLPVVSSSHSGIPELIQDGVNGHLVAEKDIDGLARKLNDLIRKPETWRQLGLNARFKIESNFNQKIQSAKLERMFELIIDNHKKKEEERPFFSIIIPTYNRERFIGKAIESVLQQTYTDYEIIVVDDGSTDQTAKIVNSFGSKVQYVYQENLGPSEARNTGIRLARGNYIAFLDSDDRFLPNKLMENKAFLTAHPNCRFLYSWYYDLLGEKKKKVREAKGFENLNKLRVQLFKRKFTIRTSTAVIHRSCFAKTGLFNPKYRYSQDWDMWLRLACYYRGYCQKKTLVLYRRHIRKKLPSKKRNLQIRINACKLYHWNMNTWLSPKKKSRPRVTLERKTIYPRKKMPNKRGKRL